MKVALKLLHVIVLVSLLASLPIPGLATLKPARAAEPAVEQAQAAPAVEPGDDDLPATRSNTEGPQVLTAEPVQAEEPYPPTPPADPVQWELPIYSITATASIDAKGGDLFSHDGQLHLSFPPNAVRTSTVITITQEAPDPARQAVTLLQLHLEASEQETGTPVTTFDRPFTVSYFFASQDARHLGRDKTDLAFLFLQPNGTWSLLGGTLQLKQQTVRATGANTGVFAVAADPTMSGYLDEMDVDTAHGGQLTSRDGKVRLDFPLGAVTGNTRISYRLVKSPQQRRYGDAQVMQFELLALNAAGDFVTHFQRQLTIAVSYTDTDVSGLEPTTLSLYYFDDETSPSKVKVLSNLDVVARTITAQVDHFSTFEPDGSPISITPALQDSTQVDLFTGSATWQLPLDLPLGPGGFQPRLALSYSSAVVNEMKNRIYAQPSWVGTGFNLTSGYILRDFQDNEHDTFFLVMDGVSERLVEIGSAGTDDQGNLVDIYKTEHESFLKIRYHRQNNDPGCDPHGDVCGTLSGWFEVWAKDGTYYRFGYDKDNWDGDIHHSGSRHFWVRWHGFADGRTAWQIVDYRLDLDLVRDPNDNSMSVSYSCVNGQLNSQGGNPRYTQECYPSEMSYANGHVTVSFETQPLVHDLTDPKPLVRETNKLTTVRVAVDGTTIRTYTFDQGTIDPETDDATARVLNKVTLLGAGGAWLYSDGASPPHPGPLFTFNYQRLSICYWEAWTTCVDQDVPWRNYLRTTASYTGGSVAYSYSELGHPRHLGWTRQTVSTRTINDGMGHASVETYSYNTGLFGYYNRPDPVNPSAPRDPRAAEFRGFGTVSVTTSAGLTSQSRVYQGEAWFGDGDNSFDANNVRWSDQAVHVQMYEGDQEWAANAAHLEGKLYEVNHHDTPGNGGGVLASTRSYYTVSSPSTDVYFIRPEHIDSTESGRTKREEYVYETTYGNVTNVKQYDLATSSSIPVRETERGYNPSTDPSKYIKDRVDYENLYGYPNGTRTRVSYTVNRYDVTCSGNLGSCSSPAPTKGNLTMVQTSDGTTDIFTRYEYDSYGNRIHVIDALNRTTTTDFDGTYHTFPTKITYPPITGSSMIEYRSYYTDTAGVAPFGALETATGVDGQKTKYEYDNFGRQTKVWKPTEFGGADPSIKYEYGDYASVSSSNPFYVKTYARSDGGGVGAATNWYHQWQFYDGLERLVEEQKDFTPGPVQVQSTQYNLQGLKSKETVPYASTSSGTYVSFDSNKPVTQYTYDVLGRVLSVQKPDTQSQSTSYMGGGWTQATDENGNKKQYETDALGRLLTVREFHDADNYWTTSYGYNALDTLTVVTDANLVRTDVQYDQLGRKTDIWDPDMGHWHYDYDAVGNLLKTTDARGIIIQQQYDALNRVIRKSHILANGQEDANDVTTYQYDGCPGACGTGNKGGRLWRRVDPDGSYWQADSFDARGRITQQTYHIVGGGTDYWMEHTFDAMDRMTSTTTHPDGEKSENMYDASGQLSQLDLKPNGATRDQGIGFTYNTQSQIKRIDYSNLTSSNSLQLNFGYHGYRAVGMGDIYDGPSSGTDRSNFGRLWQTQATNTNGTQLFDIKLGYDAAGNVTSQDEVVGSGQQVTDSATYGYDPLNRITSASVNGTPNAAQYSYDEIGDLLTKIEGGTSVSLSGHGSVDPNHPSPHHAPNKVTLNGTDYWIAYDANGNVESGIGKTLYWDPENRLQRVDDAATGSTTTFTYNGDGERIKKTVQVGTAVTTTIYVGKIAEINPAAASTSTPTPTETATSTATSTGTATATSTATRTNTPTSTATMANTPANTATPTGTATATFTKTPTPTSSATQTPIPTSTPTPANTPLPGTPTWTVTSTPTATGTATRTSTATSTATASSTPTSAPSTATPTVSTSSAELIVNGNFETGSFGSDWIAGGSAPATISSEQTHGGSSKSVSFGATASATSSWLYQTVTIPSTAASANLSFWYRPSTTDAFGGYSLQAVQIRDANGALLDTPWSVFENDQAWKQRSNIDLLAYKGQIIRIHFVVTEGASWSIGMYLDDVSLIVTEAGGTSPTATPTAQATSTWTPVPSATPTATLPAATATSTTAWTSTPTGTATATSTVTWNVTNTATPTSTGTPTSTPPGAPTQLIVNPGFETGTFAPDWIAGGTYPPTVTTAKSHNESHSARIGFLANYTYPTSSLYQVVNIPPDATTATLSFWYWAYNEFPAYEAYDRQSVKVRSASGIDLAIVMDVFEYDQVWKQRTFDLTPYRGQQIQIYFQVINDLAFSTGMYVDDVTVTVDTPPMATPTSTAAATQTPTSTATAAPPTATSTSVGVPTSTPTRTSTSTATATPMMTATPTPTVVNGCGSNAIDNGAFDYQGQGWNVAGINAPNFDATGRSGNAAQLGRVGNGTSGDDSQIYQTSVSVYSGSNASLSFWYEQFGTAAGSDALEVAVSDASYSSTPTTLLHWHDLSSGTWTPKTVDLSAYLGQTITVIFNVHLAGTSNSFGMLVDDVSLVTTCSTATPTPTITNTPLPTGTATATPAAPTATSTPTAIASASATSTMTSTPTPTWTATATATATNTPVSTDLVQNGDFEMPALASWTRSALYAPVATSTPVHSGGTSAKLGFVQSTGTSYLYQAVTIPANASSATLSFWYYPKNSAPFITTAWQVMQIKSSAGALRQEVMRVLENDQVWKQKDNIDLTTYAGQTILLYFEVKNSYPYSTGMYVDDVTLNVTTVGGQSLSMGVTATTASSLSCTAPPSGDLAPGEWIKYYYANGKPVALRRGVSTGSGVISCLYYYLSDHLGGQHALVEATTNTVVSLQHYWPFGSTRDTTAPSPANRQFTGQQVDPSTGFYYYGARYYSSVVGRFLQPDSIVPNPVNPQNLNRYTYVNNDPLGQIDPTGHFGEGFAEKAQEFAQKAKEVMRKVDDFERGMADAANDALTMNTLSMAREASGGTTPSSAEYYAGRIAGDAFSTVQGVKITSEGLAMTGAGVATSEVGVGVLIAAGGAVVTAVGTGITLSAAQNLGQDINQFRASTGGNGGAWVRLPTDRNKLNHAFDPKHDWHKTGLSQEDNVALIERIANDPDNLMSVEALGNKQGVTTGATRSVFERVYNGETIHVEVYQDASGFRVISDAWVVQR